MLIGIRFGMSMKFCKGKLTMAINHVNGCVWIFEIQWDAQDTNPSVHNGAIPELSKQDIESTWNAVKLIFEWLDCLLVDAATHRNAVIKDANVGK